MWSADDGDDYHDNDDDDDDDDDEGYDEDRFPNFCSLWIFEF